jgi:hypothetical protein
LIVTENGKSRSITTETERVGSISSLMNTLSSEEQELLLTMVDEAKKGDAYLYNLFSSTEYKRPIVDIKTWLEDPYYFGGCVEGLFPKWKDDLIRLFSGDYWLVILTGGIGIGKSTFATIAVARILYEMSCLVDACKFYGLMPKSKILIALVSITQQKSKDTILDDLYGRISNSPYFNDHFKPEKTTSKISFPDRITVVAGSYTDSTLISENIFTALLDEANFYSDAQSSTGKKIYDTSGMMDSADALFSSIERRTKTRYQSTGMIPGKIFIASSKKVDDEFTERKINDYKDDPKVFVCDYSVWDVKDKERFFSTSFKVLVGNSFIKSRILNPGEERKYSGNPDLKIIEVPDDFRPDFEKDLNGSIRELAGISTHGINPFIRSGIDGCLNLAKKYNYGHPFSSMVYMQGSSDSFVWNKMLAYSRDGMLSRPIIDPEATRHVHIDMSLNGDCTGFAMMHVSGHKEIMRRIGTEIFKEIAPIFFVDVVLRIIPAEHEEIEFSDVRKLVYALSEHGYPISLITFDKFQSNDSMQHFRKKGFKSELLSVDTTILPYETLRTAIYEERLMLYDYKLVVNELKKIEYNAKKNKVDHPIHGKKDLADCLAACCFSLSKAYETGMPKSVYGGDVLSAAGGDGEESVDGDFFAQIMGNKLQLKQGMDISDYRDMLMSGKDMSFDQEEDKDSGDEFSYESFLKRG